MSLDTAIIQQYYAGILRLTPSAATINAYAQLPSYEAAMDAMMNAAVSSVNPITKLYQAAFDRVPDSLGLTNYTAAYGAGAGTMTLQQIATQWTGTIEFTTDYPASMPNADYVGLLYWNVLHRSADPVGAANFTAALNNGTMTRAGVLLELSQSPEFAYLIDGHIQGFQEQCALNNPAAYTGSLWDKVPPGPGETFTLTTGIDVFTATTDNATFNAVANDTAANGSTLTTGDILTGAGGINTLNITGVGVSTALVETHDIQNVSIRAAGAASGFSQLLMEGVDLVSSDRSLFGTTVNGAQMATTYALNNTIAGQSANLTVNYQTVAGTADVAKLAVNNAGNKTGSTTTTQTITLQTGGAPTNLVEAVALETAGTNYIKIAAGTGVTEYVVTGSGANTIQIDDNPAAAALFDLSATTGNNTLNLQSYLTAADTVIGGSGTDTLRIAPATSISGRLQVSGFEALSVGATGGGTVSAGFGDVTGITTVNLVAAAGLDGTVFRANQLTGVNTINMTAAAAGDDVNGLTVGGASSTNVNVNVAAAGIAAAGLMTLTGVSDLAINVTADLDNNTVGLGGVTATGLTSLDVNTTGYVDAEADLSVTVGTVTASGKTIDTVDLSGSDTGVSITFAASSLANGAVVTGGTGNDTITATDVVLSGTNPSATIVGGLGADTMAAIGAGSGSTVFEIAEGDSGITLTTIDSITGFDDTATTGDYLALGVAGDDTAVTGNYATEAASAGLTFADALTAANALFATLADTTQYTQIYALQIDTTADVAWLFTDYDLDGTADQAVQIATITGIGDFSAANIIA